MYSGSYYNIILPQLYQHFLVALTVIVVIEVVVVVIVVVVSWWMCMSRNRDSCKAIPTAT